MNAIVLYVGMQAIGAIQETGKRPNIQSITHSAHMDIFQNLAVDLDTEGQIFWDLLMGFVKQNSNRFRKIFVLQRDRQPVALP